MTTKRNKRLTKAKKFAVLCLSSFVFASFSHFAHALSLGEIEVHSNLNEPLQAQIPLQSLNKTSLTEIIPQIADSQIYTQAGLELVGWLNSVQFQVQQDPQTGEPYIQIKTNHPVKDPFVDFVVQVSWPGGKLIREYTLLLDPPKIAMQQTSSKIINALSAPGAPKQPFAIPRLNNSDKSYGPTKDETLWSIAKKLIEDTPYTVYQGIAAIAEKNPDAFQDGNINRLRDGVVLTLPEKTELANYSPEKAQQIVQATPRSDKPVQLAQVGDISKKKSKPLTIVSPVFEENEKQLKKSLEELSKDAAPGKIQQRLSLIEEAIDTLRRSNEDISTKNLTLAQQNASLSELLAIKENEIKQLRHSIDQKHQLNTPGALPYAVAVPDTSKHLPVTTKTPDLNKPVVKPPIAKIPPPQPIPEPPYNVERSSDIMKRGILLVICLFIFSCAGMGWIWFRRDRFQEIWDTLKLKILSSIRKATKFKLPSASTSEPSSNVDNDLKVSTEDYGVNFDLNRALSAVVTEERKYLNPLNQFILNSKVNDAENKTEQTPLDEVEVYIAYERYSQAEKMLKTILSNDPNQWEAVLKLLELYVLVEKYSDFEQLYETLPSNLSEIEPKVWSKIELLHDTVKGEKTTVDPQALSFAAAPSDIKPGIPLLQEEDHGTLLPEAKFSLVENPLPSSVKSEQKASTTLTLENIDETVSTPNMPLPTVTVEETSKADDPANVIKSYMDLGKIEEAKELLFKMLTESPEQKAVILQLLDMISKGKN